MSDYKVSEEEFKKHIKESKNIREALVAMGYSGKGSNYVCLKERADKLNVDISHLIVNKEKYKRELISEEKYLIMLFVSICIAVGFYSLSFVSILYVFYSLLSTNRRIFLRYNCINYFPIFHHEARMHSTF